MLHNVSKRTALRSDLTVGLIVPMVLAICAAGATIVLTSQHGGVGDYQPSLLASMWLPTLFLIGYRSAWATNKYLRVALMLATMLVVHFVCEALATSLSGHVWVLASVVAQGVAGYFLIRGIRQKVEAIEL